MARYRLQITIQTEREPEPPKLQPIDPGKDPVTTLAGVMRETMDVRNLSLSPPLRQGVTLNKEVVIESESFLTMAEILAKFDRLAEEISCLHAPESDPRD